MLINPFLKLEGLLFHMHLKGFYPYVQFWGFCFIWEVQNEKEKKQSITELYAGTGVLSVLQAKLFFIVFWLLFDHCFV